MSVGRNRHHKTIKYFVPDNTRGGIVLQISKKQPVINTIAEKRVFLCTETDVSNALYEQENPENHLPVLVCLLMEQLIGLTDTAYLGRVGEAELGASAWRVSST